jgi:hypothetical protein
MLHKPKRWAQPKYDVFIHGLAPLAKCGINVIGKYGHGISPESGKLGW